MATEVNVTKRVVSGAAEYTSDMTPANAGDKMNQHYENEIIFDDITVILGSGANLTYTLNLIYPTGTTLEIASGLTSNYYMNQNSSSRNLWYRVPAWTTVQIHFTAVTTAAPVKLSVIGR